MLLLPELVMGIMGRQVKLMQKILSARADANIRFGDLVNLLQSLGFQHRHKGRQSGIK
jgi:hypothetical protein